MTAVERPTEEQYLAWETESLRVDTERVREVVDRRMPEHEAENACAARFGISLEAAICLVCRACKHGVIGLDLGSVQPRG